MPRRNMRILLILTVLCIACTLRVSRPGRLFVYAMKEIHFRALEEVPREKLLEGALRGMMEQLDEHSAYVSPADLSDFNETIDREFAGIGVEIELTPEAKQLRVASPLFGAPAYEAGIRKGDIILRIDGQSTQGLTLSDAADRMRGPAGKPVLLSVLHESEETPVDIEVVRTIVHVDTVIGDARNADGSWDYWLNGDDQRIGYLWVNSFGDQTGQEMHSAVEWLIEQDVQGLVIDLRSNPGGLLNAAVTICDMFVSSGVIVTTRSRHGVIRDTISATKRGTYKGIPIAVLINEESASASEIVAACLQDHEVAVVIGQRSYGKGTVQELIELPSDRGMIKLTTASYWRPSGQDIHRRQGDETDTQWGVTPDEGFEVELDRESLFAIQSARMKRNTEPAEEPDEATSTEEDESPPDDPQLLKAVEYIKEQFAE